jgi:hypothetical protein
MPKTETERAEERLAVADRFLDRVAALTPAQWGQLDAIGQREMAGDPLTRWRQARRGVPAVVPSVLAPPMTAMLVGMGVVSDVSIELAARLGGTELLNRVLPDEPAAPHDVDAERRRAQLRRLFELAGAQPGGAGDALGCLLVGLAAFHVAYHRSRALFVQQYAPLEPVIPFASL